MSRVQYNKSESLQKEFPEFATLDIYGTVEEPLFPGQQVQNLLGISQIRYERDFELGSDYIVAVCTAKDGAMREQNMFTEQGLYNAIFRSKTELGKKFRKFICIVLKELRLSAQFNILTWLQNNYIEAEPDAQHLYIIYSGFNSWYKIGKSKQIETRLQTLQTASPYQLKLVETFDEKGKHEAACHVKARNLTLNYRGEWFQLTSDQLTCLLEWIRML